MPDPVSVTPSRSYTGYWWAPMGERTNDQSASTLYRILYLEVDESRVPEISIQQPVKVTQWRLHVWGLRRVDCILPHTCGPAVTERG